MWKRFPDKKPKKNGWYDCTVELFGKSRTVFRLYWDGEFQQFKDFYNRNSIVVAWRKARKAYMKGFKRK